MKRKQGGSSFHGCGAGTQSGFKQFTDLLLEGGGVEIFLSEDHGGADHSRDEARGKGGFGVGELAAVDAALKRLLDEIEEFVTLGLPFFGVFGRADRAENFEEFGMLKTKIDELTDDGLQAVERAGMVGAELRFHLAEQGRETLVDDGEVKLFLGLEVDVEGALADAGDGGDIVEPHFVIRKRGEHLRSSGDDLTAFFIVGKTHGNELSPKSGLVRVRQNVQHATEL